MTVVAESHHSALRVLSIGGVGRKQCKHSQASDHTLTSRPQLDSGHISKRNAASTDHLSAAARAAPIAAAPPALPVFRTPRLEHPERHAAHGAVEDTAQHHGMAAGEPDPAAARRRDPARAQAKPGPTTVRHPTHPHARTHPRRPPPRHEATQLTRTRAPAGSRRSSRPKCSRRCPSSSRP
jgi:hypothetical protein